MRPYRPSQADRRRTFPTAHPRASARGAAAPRGLGRLARIPRALLPLVALVLPALTLACGGGEDEAARRAALERRYGPRPEGGDTAAGGGGETGGTATPGRTPEGVAGERAAPPQGAEPAPGAEPSPAAVSGGARTGGEGSGVRPKDEPPADAGADVAAGGERAPGPDASRPAGPDVDALLAGAERAYADLSSLRADFRQLVEVPLLERSREGVGIWYQKGRSRFRMDFTDPPEDEVVADGTYVWIYHPSDQPGQVIRSELAAERGDSGSPDLLARILSEARTAYESLYGGRETVSGVDTHVVELTPIRRSPYRRVRVWIGVDDRLVRRFRIVEQNESVRTVTLSNLEPNAALPDSLFRFTPPPGVDVFAG